MVVDRDWIVGICCVTAHVADDRELALRRAQRFRRDERRDLGGQIDAVDEDVSLDDLGVRTRRGTGLWQVPFLRQSA